MTTNRVTLKNVKHAKFASEETECFEATVYFDGKRVGTCGNDGHGGCNRWSFDRRSDTGGKLYEELAAYAASLPPEPYDLGEGRTGSIQPDADSLVDTALADWLTERDLKRLLSDKVVFIEGNVLKSTKKVGPATVYRWLHEQREAALKAWGTTADKVLNLMDFQSAMKAYKEFG